MQKPQPVVYMTVSGSKSHKIPTVQNVTKGSMAFPVPKQLIIYEIETITRGKIPSKNSEQAFHPDPIYRPFPRPPENLWPNSPGNRPDIPGDSCVTDTDI